MQKSKKFLISVWNEFIYGGHLLSLGAVSIVYTAAILLNIRVTWDGLLIIYLGAQSVYMYNRYKEFKEDVSTNPERTQHIKNYVDKMPLIIFFFVSIFIGILLYHRKINILLFTIFLLFLGFSYTIFLKDLTKKIPGFKNFFVSLMWTLLIIVFIIYYSFSFKLSVFLILIFVFLRVLLHEISSDIKDIESDKKKNLLVLPGLINKQRLFRFLIILSVLSFISLIFGIYLDIFPIGALLFLILLPYSFYYLWALKFDRMNNNFLYTVFIDGEYILWLPISLLIKVL